MNHDNVAVSVSNEKIYLRQIIPIIKTRFLLIANKKYTYLFHTVLCEIIFLITRRWINFNPSQTTIKNCVQKP